MEPWWQPGGSLVAAWWQPGGYVELGTSYGIAKKSHG